MTTWIKRLAIAGLLVLAVATAINDIGKYLTAYYALDAVTQQAATSAAQTARRDSQNRDAAALAAKAVTDGAGVELTNFDLGADRCTAWTRTMLKGTWVWGPVQAIGSGKPIGQWWMAPARVTGKAEALMY